MRIRRKVFVNARHFHIYLFIIGCPRVADRYGLPNGVAVAKQLSRPCRTQHHALVVFLACDQNIAQIMSLLKGESSSWANKVNLFNLEFDWADDYYAVTVSQSHVEVVRNYIKNQEEHHRKKTFTEECEEFMVKYGMVRYLG